MVVVVMPLFRRLTVLMHAEVDPFHVLEPALLKDVGQDRLEFEVLVQDRNRKHLKTGLEEVEARTLCFQQELSLMQAAFRQHHEVSFDLRLILAAS